MSAYDKLGLAMIPSGYKGEGDENNAGGFLGKVYSVLPAQTQSDNLVTNGDFSNGTTDWLPHGDAATQISVVNGRLYVEAATAFDGAKQSVVLDDGSFYKLKADIELDTATRVRVYGASGNLGLQEFTQSGSVEITFDGTSASNSIVFDCGGVIGNFYIDNVSVVRITDGDFDFSRGSDATRVNSQGYIESVQVLSDELVQNGDFEEVGSELITNGDFSDGFDPNGWQDLDGHAEITDGVLTITHTATGAHRASQSNILTQGKFYRVSFDLIEITLTANTDFRYFDGTQYQPIPNPVSGETITFYYSPNSTNSTFYFALTNGGAAVSGTYVKIDNVSVKEVGQNWTFGTGWNITDDGGNLKVEGDGTMTSADVLDYTYNFTDNNKYRFTFTISNHQSGSVYLREPFDGSADAVNKDGTYSFDYIAGANNVIRFRSNDGFTGNIDNVSVVEITDDTDIPRLDYTNAACPSLLLEPQRSNKVIESQNFTSTHWDTVNTSFTNNQGTSPDGQNNATKLVATADSNQHWFERNVYNDATIGTDYVYSAFFKSDGSDFVQIATSTGFQNKYQNFNLSNGTLSNGDLDSAGYSASIEPYRDGWYRCIVKATTRTDSLGVNARFITVPILTNVGRNVIFTGDGVNGVLTYGHQLEEGSYPTSYIPTNGSTVTRLADVCNNAGDSTIFNDDRGTLFVDFKLLEYTENNTMIFTLTDGTQSNAVWLYKSALGVLQLYVLGGGSSDLVQILNFDARNEYQKLALKFDSNSLVAYLNGEKIGEDTSITAFPTGLNKLSFDRGDGIYPMLGNIRSALYFNEALTDAELEALTSSNIDRVLKNYNRRGELLGATYESTHVKTKLNELF